MKIILFQREKDKAMYKKLVLRKAKQSWMSIILLLLIQGCAFSQAEEKNVVCVTKTGKKYHTESCRYLKDSSFRIDMKKAIQLGYTPCSVCKPGSLSSKSDSTKSATPVTTLRSEPVQKTQTTTSRQCSALTKTGMRCKRMTTDPSGKCWQHQ